MTPALNFTSLSRGTDPQALSRRRKAAIVVQMLLADGSKPPLARLSDDLQMDLTRELGALRLVDKGTLHAVAEEFARELEQVGLAAPRGMDAALAAMTGHISAAATARLKAEAANGLGVDPWIAVTDLAPKDIVPILSSEAIEICAIILSKLPVAKAAEVLGLLPGERARRITYAVSQTSGVTPSAVLRIGRAIAMQYCHMPIPAFDAPPVDRVGAILNQSQQITRDAMLEGLGVADPAFAEQVRRAIFTFGHISHRLKPMDVPRVLRSVDQPVLVTALAAATALGGVEGDSAAFLLSNMSQRMADALREEMSERGKIKKTDGEAAMASIINTIRDREDAREISLIQPADDEDD